VGAPPRTRIIGNPALGYMIQMMRQVIVAGTGGRARVGGYDLAGKTGTTSDYKDAWFVGYTGGFTAAVWVGKDNDTPMRKVTGGGAPAEIWRTFMAAALPRLATQAIPGGLAPEPVPTDAIGDVLQGAEAPPPEGDAEAPPAPDADPEAPPGYAPPPYAPPPPDGEAPY
jgi:penicillin-binding protein 1A